MKFIKYFALIFCVVFLSVFSFPYLGWVKGHYDYYFGNPKYIAYGYIESDTSNFYRNGLKPFGVGYANGGCSIGGLDYFFYKKYNDAIVSHLPPNLLDKLYSENKIRVLKKHEDEYWKEIEESKTRMKNSKLKRPKKNPH